MSAVFAHAADAATGGNSAFSPAELFSGAFLMVFKVLLYSNKAALGLAFSTPLDPATAVGGAATEAGVAIAG